MSCYTSLDICITCTRVARSNWKKKIKISSLAVSLRSELASRLWSPPPLPLKSHPALTLVSLRLSELGFLFTIKLCTQLFHLIWFWVLLITFKSCLLRRGGADPRTPPFWEAVPVRALSDRVCAIVLFWWEYESNPVQQSWRFNVFWNQIKLLYGYKSNNNILERERESILVCSFNFFSE